MFLARFMCWTTIVTELATVPSILIPSLNYWAVLANIFFQCESAALYGNHIHPLLLQHDGLLAGIRHLAGCSSPRVV